MTTSEFWAEQRILVFFRRGKKNSSICQNVLEFIFLSSPCFKGLSLLVAYANKRQQSFDKDNESVGISILTDESALALVRELTDTDWLLTFRDTAEMCDIKRTILQCTFKVSV